MNHEDAFAIEAQDEALLSRSRSPEPQSDAKSDVRTNVREGDTSDNEGSPLIAARLRTTNRASYSRAGASYDRAINEPWTGAHGAGPLPWYKRPSIFWLLPAFFPFCIAFGGIIVPKQYLILNLICKDYLSDQARKDPAFTYPPIMFGGNNPQCQIPEVQALVATFNLYFNLLSGICSAIVAPQFGALSDRIGRKKVMVWASIGGFSMEIITILVGIHPGRVSVYWILVGSLLDGLCGSFTTAMALAFAYATDCTAPERRNTAFGYFHGTLFAGIAFGPIMAAGFIKLAGNVMIAFYIALGCHVFFILFIMFITPESLSKERQAQARERHKIAKFESADKTWFTTVKEYNIFEPLWVLRPQGKGSSSTLRRNIFLLAAIDTMMFGVAMGTMNIILIYGEYLFGWDEVEASKFLSAVNICRVTGLIGILPLLTRIFRGPATGRSAGHKGSDMLDINIIRGAIVFDLLGYIGYAFTRSGTVMVLAGMIASLGGIGSPTLQSSLTKHIPANRTGQVLGASGLLHALARVVSPIIFNLIYKHTVKIYAGIVFICLASIFVVVFILSWFLKPNVYLDVPAELDDNENEQEHVTQ